MIPFLKKEILEQFRRKRVLLLGILFAAFALLGVATAKLMPAIMEMFADELAASGMVYDSVVPCAPHLAPSEAGIFTTA